MHPIKYYLFIWKQNFGFFSLTEKAIIIKIKNLQNKHVWGPAVAYRREVLLIEPRKHS